MKKVIRQIFYTMLNPNIQFAIMMVVMRAIC